MIENYDREELAKFAALSAQWWDENSDLRTLHQINPLRLRFILNNCTIKDQKILDIGCGGGILTESLFQAGGRVTGIDMNPSLIEVAKLHQFESGTQVDYLTISAEAFAEKNPEQFDVITCFELLEHVPQPESIVHAAAKLIKPGGYLFFSTINRNVKSYLFAILGAEYVLKLLPLHTHDYAKLIKPSELCEWLRADNISPQQTCGIAYSPFSKKFSITTDISVNYLLCAVKTS